MPYKVVETVEKGKPVLTAVPQPWEKEGTLYWPKYQADKLIKLEDLCPEDNWIPIPCEVKRDNLRDNEEAQAEIRSILYGRASGNEQSNRNQSIVEPSTSSRSNLVHMKVDTSMQDPLVYDEQAPTALSAALELIMENQRIMLENQRKMMRKIAEVSMSLDKLTLVSTISSSDICLNRNDDMFTPIDSQEALDDFEKDIKDPEKSNALFNRFSNFCQGHGQNTAYYLVDMLFTRKFLTKCSWAGGSRNDESKIPFKIYTNTMNFFLKVVQSHDETFTHADCNTFFKNVLRNAMKRAESKGLRASHRKHRTKHLSMIQLPYVGHDGDDFEEDGALELGLNVPEEYSRRKRRRNTDVETSEVESDAEKDLK